MTQYDHVEKTADCGAEKKYPKHKKCHGRWKE
jgi:hypothetical protein